MENILKLFAAFGIIAMIALGIAMLMYSFLYEIKFQQEYGGSGISFWWMLCQMMGIFGTVSYASDTSSEGFYEALGITAILFFIAVLRNYKRIKKLGCTKKCCRAGGFAQLIAPFGSFFIIILISSLFKKDDQDGK